MKDSIDIIKKSTFLSICLFSVVGLTSAHATIKESLASTTTEISADEAYARGYESIVVNTLEAQAKAEKWLRIASVKGHREAQHYLAIVLSRGLFGDGIVTPEALEWFREAANGGYDLSQNSLGVLYYRGHLLEQDYAKSRYWYERSAAQGNAYALLNLGIMYQKAVGVEADEAKALEYFRQCWEDAEPGWSPEGDPAIECKSRYLKILDSSHNA